MKERAEFESSVYNYRNSSGGTRRDGGHPTHRNSDPDEEDQESFEDDDDVFESPKSKNHFKIKLENKSNFNLI